MVRRGRFITFEGNEGSGKSTQVKLLYRYLQHKGYRACLTREPGGTLIGDSIREILLDHRHSRMNGLCETMLTMASRAQLVDELIAPNLKEGRIVLCDRWLDATVAYQGYGAGIDTNWIRSVGRVVTKGISPQLTLFLDLPVEVGLRRARVHKSGDRIERKRLLFHEKVRRGYREIAKRERKRFRWIPVFERDSIADVHEKVKEALRGVV